VLIGCTETGTDTSTQSIAPVVFNAGHRPTVEFSLPDMMCENGCALAVEEILERQPGAKEVQVDFEGKTATVAIDEGAFDPEQALAALVDKGFDQSALKDGAVKTPVVDGAGPKPQAAEN
jgi:copper chaperone CopZ